MTPRLSSRMTIDALCRRVAAEGGFATVLARGDDQAGAILIACAERGVVRQLLERALDPAGRYRWSPCGPQDMASAEALADYMARRRARDPDLWLIELDIAQAERFAAEMTATD